MKKTKPKTGIILALDTKNKEEAFKVMQACKGHIDMVKINYPLVLTEGISIIGEIKKAFKKPILADFKIADVPFTNNRIAAIAFENGADLILVHGFIGTDALQDLVEIAKERNKGIIVVTELTHEGGLDFTNHFSEDIAKIAKHIGAYGIQAPGTRPERVKKMREMVGKSMCIVSCGIGVQGGKPGSAIAAGADYEIVGRAIHASQNPKKAVEKIAKEIRKAKRRKLG